MITLVQRLVRTTEHGHEAFAEWWQGDRADLANERVVVDRTVHVDEG
jgi:hypothetical protein